MHKVVIVGAGFGGISAARALGGQRVDVTLVDQRNFSTFQPLLYEVATAGLDPGDVAYPVRTIFGQVDNVRFRFARVTGVDWAERLIELERADPLSFDSIIVASGATARFFGIPGAAEWTLPLYTLDDARRLRDHILRRFEEADAALSTVGASTQQEGTLTFVVVGGGPTGVEVAGAMAELLDVAIHHDDFGFARAEARIILLDGGERLLSSFEERAGDYAANALRRRGVELVLGRMVRSVDDGSVQLDDGTAISTRTVIWAGGITVEDTVASKLGGATIPDGRLEVAADLSVPGMQGVFAIGDAAAIPLLPDPGDHRTGDGPFCPQLAQVAIQSGAHAALQILNRVAERPTEPFHYRDKGIMATIGRRAAVTQLPSGLLIKGTLGWLAWFGLHILYLIGTRNKITVLVNWTWRYLSWGSGPRVIVGDDRRSSAPVQSGLET